MTPFLEILNELAKDFITIERNDDSFVMLREHDGLTVEVTGDGWIRETPRVGHGSFPFGIAPLNCAQFATPDVARAARVFVDPTSLQLVITRIAERVDTEVDSALRREATLGHLEQAIRSLKGDD